MGKILIIEDEEMLAMLEKDYLEMSNFQVTVETSGDTGLEKALNGSYDLVILDIGLPVIDGFEICKKIREQKNIPIMIVSAKKDEIDIVRGLGLGADDYVVKPFSPNELVARAKAHIAFYERLAGKRDENSIIEISYETDVMNDIVGKEEAELDGKDLDEGMRLILHNDKTEKMNNKILNVKYDDKGLLKLVANRGRPKKNF